MEWLLAAIALLAVGVVLGPFIYFHAIEGNPPSKLSLPTAASAGGGKILPGPVSGTWTVAPGSQAGYRVHEILFGQSHTAVGRTSRVTGAVIISGPTVTAATFRVEMATVDSNQAGRNAQFHGYIMQTSKYPYGSFRLTRPIQLGSVPVPGVIVTKQATGDLTLHGTTRLITFAVHAERTGGAIDVTGEIPIHFANWHIPNPSFAITKVGNTGTIEVLLHLVPAAAGH